jgi:hypothetical protein
LASKYCRIAGVAPAGSEKTGEDIVRGSLVGELVENL